MEDVSVIHDFSVLFYNYQNMVDYFYEFYDKLEKSKNYEFLELSNFLQCLEYLNQDKMFDVKNENKKINELGFVLLKIFNSICLKYFSGDNLILCDKSRKISTLIHLFDSVSLLIKVLITKFNHNICLKSLFVFINNYFQGCSHCCDYYSDVNESDEQLQQHVLKLFVRILQSLDCSNFSNHISNDVLIQILNTFPFSNKVAINIFINHIVPCVFAVADHVLKKALLKLMWDKTVIHYERKCNECKSFYHFTLLCCFSDLYFKEHFELEDFSICDDTIWKIIQKGLVSDNSYNRKQAIYVFKIILFWLKTKNNITIKSCETVPLFSACKTKDLMIWNDLVILFEVLEEKQIHVIKPVLPKIDGILQQAKLTNNLHPSWIICLLRRMIFHESKFITKQGLSTAMNINFREWENFQFHSEEFIEILIQGFNDQSMYSRLNENCNLSLFLSSRKMVIFLKEFIAAFKTELQKVYFLRNLLKRMAAESWCGVALLQLTFALTNLDSLPSWNSQDIVHIRKIIQGSLEIHESIIRTAVENWLLKSCILFIDWNTLSFEDVAELLIVFKTVGRHTEIWNQVVLKLKEIFASECPSNLSVHKAREFSLNCINKVVTTCNSESLSVADLNKLSRLLIMLGDCSIITANSQETSLHWPHLLQPLISVLMDAPNRPYMPQEKFFTALQFYTFLIDVSRGNIKNTDDIHFSTIINCLGNPSELLEFLYQKSLMDLKGIDDVIHFQMLYDALYILSTIFHSYELSTKLLPNFITSYNSLPQYFLSKKIVIVLLYSTESKIYTRMQLDSMKESNSSLLLKIINEHIIDDLSKSVFINQIEKDVMQKLATKSICKFWETTSYLNTDQVKLITSLSELAQNMFNGGSKSTYVYTTNCIKTIIPKLGLQNKKIIEDLLNGAWKACSELHGCEAYRSAINSFIGAVFQPFMLNEKFFDILYKYLNCFRSLSENTIGIFYLVIRQFCNAFPLKSLSKLKFDYIPIFIHSLTYEPIHHKSQKILEDTIAYISVYDQYFNNEFKNYNKPSVFVRITAIMHLLRSLHEYSSENKDISWELINSLLNFDDTTRRSKSSKFANSSSHRIRNRIWQIVLLLQPNLITKVDNGIFLQKILSILECESQQPSIRYLQEWVIMKILNDYRCFIEHFISVLENSVDKRPGFLVSLLSILTHLVMHEFLESEDHISKCFPLLISYCMAQNFAVRLHSRLAITKLFLLCKKKALVDILQKYDFLHDILFSQLPESIESEKGNVYKNLLKLQEDFYFSVFHPIKHFTLETIFYDLPRLSNVTSEEWIKPEYLEHEAFRIRVITPRVHFCNTGNGLKNCVAKSFTDKSIEDTSVLKNDSFDYNFQKKISPPRCEVYDYTDDFCLEKKPKNNGLIVIASLIDKIPNLGGLCRTCEVFGVTEFVIGSSKYTEDKQFQNLAVSADRWVSIKEVKPYHLKEYLLSLKEIGYTLIGAEQTDDGHKLTNYTFPKKSAILLGHEKEGVPVDLIQLLDACVEIPQQGIIRSLNVHVSGAIFIWEYARQQILQFT